MEEQIIEAVRPSRSSSWTVYQRIPTSKRIHREFFSFSYTRFSIPTSAVLMWNIITSACPFLHRNLTLNLSDEFSHCSLRKITRNYYSIWAHTVSRSVSCAASLCPVCPALLCPALRPPASQCAPGLTATTRITHCMVERIPRQLGNATHMLRPRKYTLKVLNTWNCIETPELRKM